MLSHRINAKLFFADTTTLDDATFIPLFHHWIQNKSVPGLLIDVADYRRVPGGPGVLLIGHEGDYAIDFGQGRPGLLYSRKRRGWPAVGSSTNSDHLSARLCIVLEHLIRAAQVLEKDFAQQSPLFFRTDELELTFPDRLQTPNRPETLEALIPEVRAVLTFLYGDVDISIEQGDPDPRYPLVLRIQVSPASDLATLAGRLETTGAYAYSDMVHSPLS